MLICKECGATELYLTIEYIINYSYVDTLSCSCEDSSEEIAAQRWWTESIQYQDRGFVYNDHEIEIDDKNNELETETEDQEFEVNCDNCFEDANTNDWETDTKSYFEEDSETTYVFCAGCDREIEFGWSNPKRRKKIYPIESDDFNPNKCLVEERFKDKWLKRGWLSNKNTGS